MTSPDFLDIVPERILDPVRRPTLAARLGMTFGFGLVSLLVNAAVVGWLITLGWPLRSAPTAPDPISVEIVDHVPGEKNAGAPERGSSNTETKPQAEASPPSTSDHTSSEAAAPLRKEPDPTFEKPATPTAEPRQEAAEPTHQEPAQATPPTVPATEPAPSPSPQVTPDPTGALPNTPQSPGAAVPPPPEHPDNEARPQLVEAPKPPGPAAAEGDAKPADAPPEPAKPDASPPQAEAPTFPADTSSDSDVLLPAPAAPPKKPPEPTADQKRQAENTAKLAAMLPFGPSIAANPFQSGLTGQNSATSQAYRGAVYGAFAKARDVVEAAQAQHLRGQAVVAFTLDDHGGLASLGIAVSSGHPDVDKAALDYIRRSAPFPPPPPGAQRSFSPAIGFGLGE